METLWMKINPDEIYEAQQEILQAGEIVKNGGLVGFPTETVYGLGGDALSAESSKKIYAAKGRPSDNPLIVHICQMDALGRIVKEIPPKASMLAKKFWPGPLTMIFQKSEAVPYETTGGLDTVAVRFPNHPVALAFIKAAGGYVAAPSANTSGRPSPTIGEHVYEDLNGRIDALLDSGSVGIGLESTIVDMTGEVPMLLRPGYVTYEMLVEVLGEVSMDTTMMHKAEGVRPKAPGMMYRHYAPKGELTIVSGESENVISYINRQIVQKKAEGRSVGVMGTSQMMSRYEACNHKDIGDKDNEEEIAHNLYDVLRAFDSDGTEYIYSESFDTSGIGQAIMNRLLKAAGHRMIEV